MMPVTNVVSDTTVHFVKHSGGGVNFVVNAGYMGSAMMVTFTCPQNTKHLNGRASP